MTPLATLPRPGSPVPRRRERGRAVVAKGSGKAEADPLPVARKGRAGSTRQRSAPRAAMTVRGSTEKPRPRSWRTAGPRNPDLKLPVQPGVRARGHASSGKGAWRAPKATSASLRTTIASRCRLRRKSRDDADRGRLVLLLPRRRRRMSLDGLAVLVQPVRARPSWTQTAVPRNRRSAWRWWLSGPATSATKPSCKEDR